MATSNALHAAVNGPFVNTVTDALLASLWSSASETVADDVSLDELARVADLSAKHFARTFKQSTGVPPHRWLISQRIGKTRELMASGDLDISEIALACGFEDQSHFTVAFSNATGVNPGAYRRNVRS